jgi:glycosyltransferase involved in cell wall biosynthesis
MNPLVSSIIPCFNAEKYLREAVESALAQTYRPIEVIVVDDGSTDAGPEIARSFGDRVRLVSQNHCGASAARNHGMNIANGYLIQFLDADDLLDPIKLERQVPLACECPETVTCTEHLLQTGPDVVERHICLPDADDPVVFALYSIPLSSGPLHWRKSLKAVGGFRDELTCCQDYDLLLRLACEGFGIHVIHEPLWTHRRIEGSLSSSMLKVLNQLQPVYDAAMDRLTSKSPLSAAHRAAFAGKMAKDARRYLKLGHRQQGLAQLSRARELDAASAVRQAYPGPKSRISFHLLGPVLTEKLAMLSRSHCRKLEKGL